MAAFQILLSLIFLHELIYLVAPIPEISSSTTLSTSENSKWDSPNGQFAFGFYTLTPTLCAGRLVASASMLDSGNFVLLNAQSNPIWQSFDYPTDTLLPGQMLKWKADMFSKASPANYSTGRFQLSMQ
ncbi:hypothetical protein SUGI_0018800 [Cryptomeria japonica]|nr:hypothetical protein SUGI_0018800 [Cryptomeria japonica]